MNTKELPKHSSKRKIDFLERLLWKSRDSILKQMKNNKVDIQDQWQVAVFVLKEISKML